MRQAKTPTSEQSPAIFS